MNTKKDIKSFDFILVILVFTLIIMGIIAIGSATQINIIEDSRLYRVQQIWFLIGIVLMVVVAFVDYEFIGRFYVIFYVVNLVLLILVLFSGKTANGAARWLSINDTIGIQPSEFAKVIMIICLSKIIDKKREKINNIIVLFFITVFGLIPAVLVIIQPSLSAGLVILAIFAVIMFLGGVSYKHIIIATVLISITGFIFITDIKKPEPKIISYVIHDYQLVRIKAMIEPELNEDGSWQTRQSIKAIGSGQLKGKGLYNSDLNKLNHLPESHNDFIFSVIGEEFGFIGCSIILSIIFIIILKCIWIAKNAIDTFGRLIAVGVAGMFAFQTFVNVGVTTGMLPATGMPLPFVSYGGSSLWANMVAIGLVLNIRMKKQKSFFEGD